MKTATVVYHAPQAKNCRNIMTLSRVPNIGTADGRRGGAPAVAWLTAAPAL
jgi:hypothetical protein